MTLTIDLPQEAEQSLLKAAAQQGMDASTVASRLLVRELSTPRVADDLAAIFEQWRNEDSCALPDEVLEALDENRLGQRKLFPQELKGITW